MVRDAKDAILVLKNTLECLVLRYQYDAAKGTLEIVVGYLKKPGHADRTFLRIRFANVTGFRRVPGAFLELQRFTESYAANATLAATVVQNVHVDQQVSPWRIALWFGHSFGGIEFACDSLAGEFRDARATQLGEDMWRYTDLDDDTQVDFYDPFA